MKRESASHSNDCPGSWIYAPNGAAAVVAAVEYVEVGVDGVDDDDYGVVVAVVGATVAHDGCCGGSAAADVDAVAQVADHDATEADDRVGVDERHAVDGAKGRQWVLYQIRHHPIQLRLDLDHILQM